VDPDQAASRGEKRGQFARRAYDELLNAILEQRLPPGTRLVPDDLARQLGVSVTPVKFALARLAVEGLVEGLSPYRTVVTRLDPGALDALYDARLLLETATVREFAGRIDDAFLEQLDGAAARYRLVADAIETALGDAPDGRTRRRLVDADRDFHRLLVGLAANPHLTRWYELANTHLQANRSLHPRGALRQSVAEHAAIVDACHRREAAALEEAVRAHVAGAAARSREQQAAIRPPALRPIAPRRA
jgi:DNA-binding GntR family transcriptional regulator